MEGFRSRNSGHRAAVIETLLFAREYIKRREKKSLVPTGGPRRVRHRQDMRIADAAMTGGWGLALAKIATGGDERFHLS